MGWIPNLNCLAGFPPFPPSTLRINLIHAWWPSLARLPGFIKVGSGGVCSWCIGVLFQWLVWYFYQQNIWNTHHKSSDCLCLSARRFCFFVAPGVLHSNRESHPRHWAQRFFFQGWTWALPPCHAGKTQLCFYTMPEYEARMTWWGGVSSGHNGGLRDWESAVRHGRKRQMVAKASRSNTTKADLGKTHGKTTRDCAKRHESWRTSKWKLLHNYKSWIVINKPMIFLRCHQVLEPVPPKKPRPFLFRFVSHDLLKMF